jgi:hypothetical protein
MAPVNFHNIRSEPSVTKWEVMRAKLGIAAEQHPLKDRAVGDFLLTGGRDEQEARYLTSMRQALQTLALLPTARLERLLTEHIDTCTYRLDSWQTAMFAVRLDQQRKNAGKGIFLGAVGWVEDLRPAARTMVAPESVPQELQPPAGEALYEYADNGGFVHAPSLNHASAAAVLRSGYLSHATSAHPNAMAVNLSSERVRRALFLLQGVRNGQPLEALLGYQFERELHDAASLDGGQIRLNEYIYDFRDAFPIERHVLQQQGSSDAQQFIPAENVVNGVTLAEKAGNVPYGATGDVTGASEAEKTTIRNAKDRLADSLDAVKDLLLSEGAFQMVQGNMERAGAVMTAMKDTNPPPELDVINTPRGSLFSFTNRLTVQFGAFEPDDAASNPWATIAMTPRARMEPGMNLWLKNFFGDDPDLVCRVAHLDGDGNEVGNDVISVAALKLQPIDLIYLIGNELNTGAPQEGGESRTSVSELEVRIAWAYRTLKNLEDSVPIRIEFLKPTGQKTLGKYLLLLRTLKSMITDSRPLHGLDFVPSSKMTLADAANPEGYNVARLETRVQIVIDASEQLRSDIDALPIEAVVTDENDVDQQFSTLGAAFAALTNAELTFAKIAVSFADADAQALQGLLIKASNQGISDAFPMARVLTEKSKVALLDQARSVSRRLSAANTQAASLVTQAATATAIVTKVSTLVAAGKAVLAEMFNILPDFQYNNDADIQLSNADRAQLLKHGKDVLHILYPAEEWLHSIAHVRPRSARWDRVLSLHETFTETRLGLSPVQLPFRTKDSWLAIEFPDKDPQRPTEPFNIAHDTLAITIHGDVAFAAGAPHRGLLIDDWTELLPSRSEITGIAFNYDQPNAAPPQALLLAVSPTQKGGWSWDHLLGIVNDTILRSKLRAVEPRLLDSLNKPELNVLLPAVLADFSQIDLNLALDFRTNIASVAQRTPIEAVALSMPD